MNKTVKITALAIGMMALVITGCKKDKLVEQNATTTQIAESDADILGLVSQAELVEDNMEVTYNEGTEDLTMANDGIAADYLVEESDLEADENSNDATVAKRKNIRQNSFILCLRKLDLKVDQKKKIKWALKDYKNCRESSIKRARAIYAQLYAKYKKLAVEQIRLYKAGKITKKELINRITRIRYAFHKELRSLKVKVNAALKTCYAKFLRNLKGTLTEKQWIQFICCYKGH
jgi:hypothetical protein